MAKSWHPPCRDRYQTIPAALPVDTLLPAAHSYTALRRWPARISRAGASQADAAITLFLPLDTVQLDTVLEIVFRFVNSVGRVLVS